MLPRPAITNCIYCGVAGIEVEIIDSKKSKIGFSLKVIGHQIETISNISSVSIVTCHACGRKYEVFGTGEIFQYLKWSENVLKSLKKYGLTMNGIRSNALLITKIIKFYDRVFPFQTRNLSLWIQIGGCLYELSIIRKGRGRVQRFIAYELIKIR